MKKLILVLLGITVITATMTIAIQNHWENMGIITLDGYPHAVVVCGEAITINHGHGWDIEIATLLEKADRLCPKK